MESRVEKMVMQRDSVAVHFLSFMGHVAKDKTKTICFFEGEDQKYFSIRIDLSVIQSKWIGVDCGGKKNVLDLHSLISRHETYKNSLVAFFIDRDFDAPIVAAMRDLIFETPCYSIENFYCTDFCLSKVFDIEFKLTKNEKNPELANTVLEDFRTFRTQFQKAIRPLNVWIKAHRTKEKQEGARKLNLQNIALDKFITVTKDKVEVKYTQLSIRDLFPDCYVLTEDEIHCADESLPVEGSHLHFRGKYQIEFVRLYLTQLRAKCKDKTSAFFNPNNVAKLSLSKGNLISELSQYAETPDSLTRFLNSLNKNPT